MIIPNKCIVDLYISGYLISYFHPSEAFFYRHCERIEEFFCFQNDKISLLVALFYLTLPFIWNIYELLLSVRAGVRRCCTLDNGLEKMR